ncbi:helix-turn-helix domain-containing protein [Desertivirga xinjiangensis]|uniref:helix-turn-helix domain-containing protein n=1 Tax=Desertivirga xinjiangensis TaxID=539206 RepID=UPI00210E65E5|nr:helix-turn-helix transcriptional regulator [Pedobacter xinjiangensis]
MKPKTYGEKLQAFRKHKKLSQEEVADKVGKKHTTISKYERGAAEPPLDVIKAYNKVLGMNLEWYLNDDAEVGMDDKQKRPSISTDISSLKADYKILQTKFEKLEATVKVLLGKFEKLKTGQNPVK